MDRTASTPGQMETTNGSGNSESSFSHYVSSFDVAADSILEEDEELQLQWGAIERLPTLRRIRTSLFDIDDENKQGKTGKETEGKRVTDVTKLGAVEKHLFIEKLIKHIENDNHQLLQKMRERINRVNVELPTVEVRYKNLSVEAECEVVKGKPLPTLWNSVVSSLLAIGRAIKIKSQGASIAILRDVSGIIKPSRLTLLLGPPGCGKTTLLLALAGKLDDSLKITGEISYNGYSSDEFVPQKNAAYISQHDLHIPEMTVRETIDFSARCQGVGSREDIMIEISKREKEAGIMPDTDIDTYMKAISVDGKKRNLQTDYVLKILGLDICADTMNGSALRRGISGGQRKRLTTGEMIVGPRKALFMDEISNGLDSSTTFQIVICLQQLVHMTDLTALISLLQPAPETFDLFDDIILMAEGKIVYHGPCSDVLQFFKDCGFKCPERKNVADFLQEVTSKKDQAQYWCHADIPYSYVSVDHFSGLFKASYLAEKMKEELSKPYDRSKYHQNALSFTTYPLGKWELFKACWGRELLLMKRNSFVYVFKKAQLIITALITMTLFIRTETKIDSMNANYLVASMFYAVMRLLYNGIAELTLTVLRLPIVHKQRSFCLYPTWAYAIPASILKIPLSLADSFLWTAITYYVIGYSPEMQRFFYQFLLLFAISLASSSLWRFLAAVFQTMVLATTVASMVIALMYFFGGFILPQTSLPLWLRWAFWIYPVSYAEIGASVNEFLAPRWQQGNTTTGKDVLSKHGLNFNGYFYWISLGVLVGFAILMDFGFVLALTYLKPPRMSRALISKKMLSQLHGRKAEKKSRNAEDNSNHPSFPQNTAEIRKMVLPFQPLTVAFREVQYFVIATTEMKKNGFNEKKLQLLHDITGAFRPGILTALMGVSGAGKTTLMDVLSGRKTIGIIEGDIRIGGYPKVQKTFARISGYCEQNDIHSPQITVEESVTYSAWLRLPPETDRKTRARFVEEVIETVELDDIKDSLVGIPGKSGLSTEQRKRLTVAVELVSNPSVIFMDEPTSGLDARAAAIVMRAVKNVVSTGRTVVCTIHQPSIDVFETFDELLLMKIGGQIIYSGKLGQRSSKLIEYFEGISGVPKIKDNYNPSTWMLEVTSASMEAKLGLDFARIYKESALYKNTVELVRQLSEPQAGAEDLYFPSTFAQSNWTQFKACLWKQHLSYWRSPNYNLARFIFIIAVSLMVAAIFWQKAQEIYNEQDLFNILGSMYCVLILVGVNNCATILPYVATERNVLYREQFAGMYSTWNYSLAQVMIEIPYVLLQAILYTALSYPAMGYDWSAIKLFRYLYTTFCTFLYFVYLGLLIASICPTLEVSSILAAAVYPILNLFAGFLMPGPKMPKWWIWCYWICPTSWSLNGFLTAQYGDMKKEISAFGETTTVSSFLQEYYGFHHDHLGLVAALLAAFPVVYAALYAYFLGKLNFQKR